GRRLPTPDGFSGRGTVQRMSMSPDGDQIVFDNLDATTGIFKIWTIDVVRGIASKLTARAGDSESTPVWAPADGRIAFVNEGNILEEQSDGTNRRTLFTNSDSSIKLDDWSADGRVLLFTRTKEARTALWMLDATPGGTKDPVRLTFDAFNAAHGAFSPDGKWIAYDSDMSGTEEIYVQPLASGGTGRLRISSAGGVVPHWRSDG